MKVYLKSGQTIPVDKNTGDYLLKSKLKFSAVHRGDGAGERPLYFNMGEVVAIY